MNLYWEVFTLLSMVHGSLHCDLSIVGLFEGFNIQGHSEVQYYPTDKIILKIGLNSVVSISLLRIIEDSTNHAIYGTVDYEMLRKVFYTNEVANNEILEILYTYKERESDGNNEIKRSCYVNLFQDHHNMFVLKCHRNVYMKLMGDVLRRISFKINCMRSREQLSDFSLETSREFILYHFKTKEECLNVLKSIIQEDEILFHNTRESCLRFLKKFVDYHKIVNLKLEHYSKAYYMLIDLINILNVVLAESEVHDVSVSPYLSSNNSIVNVYRSVCLNFGSSLFDDLEDKQSSFQVIAYDVQGEVIPSDSYRWRKISNMIVIPIDDIHCYKILHAEVISKERSTGKVDILKFVKDENKFIN